jgi:hypothetical protein
MILTDRWRSYVFADLPRTGLGNMLLVWARALVFAHLNDLPLIVGPWAQLRIGPFLRREKRKRLYLGFFEDQSPVGRLEKRVALGLSTRILEPPITTLPPAERRGGRLYVFNALPHWSEHFQGIKEHRDRVRDALFAMLSRRTRAALSKLEAPVVGLHVRMGDYRALKPGEDFKTAGLTRTPLGHFVDVIEALRKAHGSRLPVTLFSDGHDHELRELLAIPGVKRAPASSDIVDMLLLARSRVIVCSAGSTFSYWSAFLADAPVILHPDHIHKSIRGPAVNAVFYEGAPAGPDGAMPALLEQNIRAIRRG